MTMTEPEHLLDESLIRRCVAGERMAWRALHQRYYPVAISFLRRLGVSADELEDACQEVFLRMFRALPGFRGESDPKTWLYRLCVTEARGVRRRRRIGDTLRSLLRLAPRELVSAGLDLCPAAAARRVEHGLQAMSDPDRAVFVMYELDGLPGKQIAGILQCPEATLWRRLHYARKAFRGAIVEHIEPGGGA